MDIVIGIVRLRDQFAFLQRHNGTWTFPGGKVEEGETLDTALMREVREETGLTVTPVFNLGSREEGSKTFYYKVCQYLDGEISLKEPDQFLSAQWMSADKIMAINGGLHFAPVRRYLQDVQGVPHFSS